MNKINPYKVYGDLLFSWITKGRTEKLPTLPTDSVGVGFNRIVSQDYCTYMFQLSSFGDFCDYELFTKFRQITRKRYSGKVYIDIVSRSRPYKVNWNSRALQDSRKSWQKQKKVLNVFKRKDKEAGYSDGVSNKVMTLSEKKEYSWNYFRDAEVRGEESLLYSLIFRVKIPKSDADMLDELMIALDSAASSLSLTLDQCKICMSDYMHELSPFKHEGTKFASTLIAERAETTGVTTKFHSTEQNRLPQGKVILGNDVYNKKLVSLDIKKELVSGASMFIYGETGSGKSTLLKNIDEELSANKFFIYLTDYERNEYTEFGNKYGAVFLEFGGGAGYYYEPLQLSEPTGIPLLDMDIFPNAVANFISYVNIYNRKRITPTQEIIISEAIKSVFASVDVDHKDPSTFYRAKNVTMRDVQKYVSREVYSVEAQKRFGDDLRKIADVLELAFSESSVRSYILQKPIKLDDLKNARIIIYKFGKDSKGDLVDGEDIEIAVSQLSKMILDQELARVRRSRNEAFAVEYEEVQRYIKHAGSIDSLNTTYTGIRKANGFVISVLNDASVLTGELASLVNNSKYVLIGKCDDLNLLQPLFNTAKLRGCENIVAKLNDIKNGFFIKTPDMESIFRVELPKYMIDGPIYKTVDVKE